MLATTMLAAFLHATDGQPLRMLDRALARRARDRMLTTAEVGLLDAAAALVRTTAR